MVVAEDAGEPTPEAAPDAETEGVAAAAPADGSVIQIEPPATPAA